MVEVQNILIITFKSHTDLYLRVKFSGNIKIYLFWGGVKNARL